MSGKRGYSEYFDTDNIVNDNHAIELSNKLAHATDVHHIRFWLSPEANVTHEGLKAIAQSMRGHPKLRTFCVPWVQMSSESIVEVVKVLYFEGNLHNLREICFDDKHANFFFNWFRVRQDDERVKDYNAMFPNCRLEGKVIEFAACLHGNTQLRKLAFMIDYNFTPEDASVLAAAMCNSQVTDLRVYNYMPRVTMKGDLLRILCRDGIQALGRIWECLKVDASFARVDDMSPVADVIPFVKSLWIHEVGEKQQTRDEMHCLFLGLERSCNLVRLELVQCQMDADDMRMLSRALRHHRSLKELDLSFNSMRDAGVAALIEHWDDHPILEFLGLCCNRIGPTGAQQLINAVVNHPSMTFLNMDFNILGCSGLQTIGEQLPNLRLKVLNLEVLLNDNDNDVDKQRAYQSLLRGLKDNYFLHKLELPRIFYIEFGSELSFYVKLSKHGRYLVTDVNAVAPTIWCTILAKCGCHLEFSSSMVFYFLQEQPHLVRRAESMVLE